MNSVRELQKFCSDRAHLTLVHKSIFTLDCPVSHSNDPCDGTIDQYLITDDQYAGITLFSDSVVGYQNVSEHQ